MAFKIFKKTNYIYIVDTETDQLYEGLAKDVRFNRRYVDDTLFYINGMGDFPNTTELNFADILDENGDAYTDLATFVAWYEDNTGFNVAGATALLTPFLSYSTDETLTGGTWIDGKPIYRKAILFNTDDFTTNSDAEILHNLNIETYLLHDIVLADKIEERVPRFNISDCIGSIQDKYIFVLSDIVIFNENNINCDNYINNTLNTPFYLVLEYTKTID